MKIAITSGYFNPIHPGHIECFKLAKELPNVSRLCVIVNNDEQAFLKRGVSSFQKQEDRIKIVKSIKWVDDVVMSSDKDLTVCDTLNDVALYYKVNYQGNKLLFCKGGDRFSGNIPEEEICKRLGISLIDGLGDKTHNSSDYISGLKKL